MLLIALCVYSLTPCVAVGGKLVEDVFQLILVVAVLRKEGKVEHGSKAHIIVILVVYGVAQIVGAVVGDIVYTKEVVLHVAECALLVGVVECGEQSERTTTEIPAVSQTCSKLDVAYRFAALDAPVVVEPVATKVVEVVAYLIACGIEVSIPPRRLRKPLSNAKMSVAEPLA